MYLSCGYKVFGECLETKYPFYKSCNILYIFSKSKSNEILLIKLNALHALDYFFISSIAFNKVSRIKGRFLSTDDEDEGSLQNDDLRELKLCIIL